MNGGALRTAAKLSAVAVVSLARPAAAQDLTALGFVVIPPLVLVPWFLALVWQRLLERRPDERPPLLRLWFDSTLEAALWLVISVLLSTVSFFGRWHLVAAVAVVVVVAVGWSLHRRRLGSVADGGPGPLRVALAVALAPIATLLAMVSTWGVIETIGR